ncbi:MAG: cytidine deaminase [Gemmatimonadetes bacterium]|nr:cytidine deaminase [Gemmatimonadota bacterium]
MSGAEPEVEEARWGELVACAVAAMRGAYAPYSRFLVGAALETDDGRVFDGCNVENSSYPVGICAERVAIGHAVVSGARCFTRLVVASSGSAPASPCGMCRQALAEFGTDLEIRSVTETGEELRWTLDELLPAHFRLDDLVAGARR